MEFVELCFAATLNGVSSLGMPFWGATLRGALGYTLKRLCCQVKHGQCQNCLLSQVCPYTCIFEGWPSPDRQIMRKYPSVPQPFVLVLPSVPCEVTGTELTWSLRLFGPACRYWPYLVFAYQRIGEEGLGKNRVRYTLEQVTDRFSGQIVWSAGASAGREPTHQPLEMNRPIPSDHCTLRWVFHTPLKLRLSGKNPTGLDLVLAGRRRYQIMNYFYGSGEDSAHQEEPRFAASDFTTREVSLRPWNLRRFSGRQKRLVEFYGLVGEITIEGPWGLCGEWLRAIPILHLGKATSFGFGQVSWEVVS